MTHRRHLILLLRERFPSNTFKIVNDHFLLLNNKHKLDLYFVGWEPHFLESEDGLYFHTETVISQEIKWILDHIVVI